MEGASQYSGGVGGEEMITSTMKSKGPLPREAKIQKPQGSKP
jgi:hypothetical protein